MNEAQGGRGKNWGGREIYKVMFKMSTMASQKENENAAISSGQMSNVVVRK